MTLVESKCGELCSMTDEELSLLARSSKGAAEELISRYTDVISVKARLFARCGAEPDDLRQEGLISLLGAIYAFKPERGVKFSTFSEVCINNRMRTILRKRAAACQGESLDDGSCDKLMSQDESPESVCLYKELLSELKNGINSELSSAEKRTFELCIQGFSYKSTARMLGISEKAVDNAMQRARRKLRAIVT